MTAEELMFQSMKPRTVTGAEMHWFRYDHALKCLECCRHYLDPSLHQQCLAARWYQHEGIICSPNTDKRFPGTIQLTLVPSGWHKNTVIAVITAVSSFQVWEYRGKFENLLYNSCSDIE